MSLIDAVRTFVEEEVRLLDDRHFDAWLALYTPDCRYWVPVSREQTSPREGPSHFHDDLQLMMARTHRLENPRAFGAEPAPQTAHVVSGVRIEADDGTELTVSSSQIVIEYRQRGHYENDQRMFGGRVTHVLRRDGKGFRIASKRVDLINAGGSFNALAAPF
jgi:benzoate/toluate 1,2-dioxygenase beta subunit